MVSPKKALCDFIADLCDITSQHPERSKEYLSNGSADRDRARAYYDRIHSWRANWLGAVEHGVPDFLPAALSDCFICIGTYTGMLCVFTRDGKWIKKFKVGKHIYTDLTASGTNLIFGVGRSLVCCKLVV